MAFTLDYLLGGNVDYPPGARLALRRMHDYELVWIQRGHVAYHCNGRDLPAAPGTVILSRPGFDDGYTWDLTQATRHAYFHLTFSGVPADWPAPPDWPILHALPEHDIVRPLFEFVVASIPGGYEANPGATVTQAVQTLLSALLLGPLTRRQEVRGVYPEPVYRALEYIGRTLRQDAAAKITLANLAAAALVSDKHLCRVFARALATSPMDAVMAYRLYQAAQLLVRTDLKLAAVARHGGFATPFHFSRRFREFYGKPPGAYRAEALAGEAGGGRTMPPQLRFGRGLAVEY